MSWIPSPIEFGRLPLFLYVCFKYPHACWQHIQNGDVKQIQKIGIKRVRKYALRLYQLLEGYERKKYNELAALRHIDPDYFEKVNRLRILVLHNKDFLIGADLDAHQIRAVFFGTKAPKLSPGWQIHMGKTTIFPVLSRVAPSKRWCDICKEKWSMQDLNFLELSFDQVKMLLSSMRITDGVVNFNHLTPYWNQWMLLELPYIITGTIILINQSISNLAFTDVVIQDEFGEERQISLKQEDLKRLLGIKGSFSKIQDKVHKSNPCLRFFCTEPYPYNPSTQPVVHHAFPLQQKTDKLELGKTHKTRIRNLRKRFGKLIKLGTYFQG